jgi:hypothetical protein
VFKKCKAKASPSNLETGGQASPNFFLKKWEGGEIIQRTRSISNIVFSPEYCRMKRKNGLKQPKL